MKSKLKLNEFIEHVRAIYVQTCLNKGLNQPLRKVG